MKLKIIKIIKETHDTKTLRFQRPENFNFIAGQFIIISVEKDEKKIRRSYSISSSPTEKDYIDLTFKKYETGQVTPILYNLKEGDGLEALGPFGKCTYEDGSSNNIIMLAGGSGISTIMGIIRYINIKNLDVKITLLFANKATNDIIFKNELQEISNKNKNFKEIDVIEFPDSNWNGYKGRITAEIIKENVPNLDNPFYYIVGPPAMVKAMVELLKSLNLKEEKIKIEVY